MFLQFVSTPGWRKTCSEEQSVLSLTAQCKVTMLIPTFLIALYTQQLVQSSLEVQILWKILVGISLWISMLCLLHCGRSS